MVRPSAGVWRRLSFIAALALIGATVFSSTSLAAGGSKDRFKATGAVSGAGEGSDLRTPLEYEANAAANPVTAKQGLFSRCRFAPFAGTTGTYAAFQPREHDVIDNDTSFAFADGTSCWNPQNESNIVINPTDTRNIVSSSNDYRYEFRCFAYVSKDGGSTWTNVAIPGWSAQTGATGVFATTGCGGDPVMAFGPDGTLYFAGLTYDFSKYPAHQASGVAVSSSKDGGLHWSAPVMVDYTATGDFFNDKEWIGVGNDGTVYLTWTKFYQGPRGFGYIKSPIVMSSSRTGGKSWSSTKEVSDSSHPYNQGSQVGMLPNGDLLVAYEGATPDSGYNQDATIVARSTDGGKSFTNAEIARVYDDLNCYPHQIGAQGRQTLSFEQFRNSNFPSMAIDPTNGHIAIVWADNQGAGTCGTGDGTGSFSGTTSNQVKLITSSNGTSWSSVRAITATVADKAYPSVGANHGVISVGYYTRDYSPVPTTTDRRCGIMERDSVTGALVLPVDPARAAAPVCLDWAVKMSNDNFSTQIRVTSQSSNPYILFSGSFIGDYTGTAVNDLGKTVTVWTDFRGNPGVTSANQDTMVGILP